MNFARLLIPLTVVALAIASPSADAAPRSKRASKAARNAPALSIARSAARTVLPSTKIAQTPEGLFEQAKGAVTLKGAQKEEIRVVSTRLLSARTSARHARAALLDALASQAGHGRFDRALLRSRAEAVVDTAVTEDAAERTALETLHETIEPAERTALVEALLHEEKADSERTLRQIDRISNDLKLTADQKKALKSVMTKHVDTVRNLDTRAKGSYRKILEAFKRETLSVDRVVPPGEARIVADRRAKELISAVQQITTKLTPEQRRRLASQLHAHAHQGRVTLDL